MDIVLIGKQGRTLLGDIPVVDAFQVYLDDCELSKHLAELAHCSQRPATPTSEYCLSRLRLARSLLLTQILIPLHELTQLRRAIRALQSSVSRLVLDS